MSRLQLALNVPDLEEAIGFYSSLFGAEPHKRKPGYANFSIDDPPLKLVLVEGDDDQQVNHLGIEVTDTDEVTTANDRLTEAGMVTDVRTHELCCHAVQDKVWVGGPNATRWEVYVVTDDQPEEAVATEEPPRVAAGCC